MAQLLSVVRQGRLDAVQALLRQGAADVSGRQFPGGPTPLHVAAQAGHISILRTLLAAGADTEAAAELGLVGGFHNARPLLCAVQQGDEAAVRALIDAGASVNATADSDTEHGSTGLHSAIEHGHSAIARRLLDAGANPEAAASWTEEHNVRPLHFAARQGLEDVLRMLLHAGVDVRATVDSTDGLFPTRTALHIAAEYGQWGAARILLDEAGVGVDAVCGRGWTPLMYAARDGHRPLVLLFRDRYADVSHHVRGWDALRLAAANNHAEIIPLLLHGTARSPWVAAALHEAVAMGSGDAVRALVYRCGADVDARDPRAEAASEGRRPGMPLHTAVAEANIDMLRLLLEAGASVDAENGWGHRPVQMARAAGWSEGVRLLSNAQRSWTNGS